MIYVLDTDILSLLARKDSPEAPRIRRRILELPVQDSVVTTIINYEEQMRGWLSAIAQAKTSEAEIQIYHRLLQHLETFRRIAVLGYEDSAANVSQRLKTQRTRIGTMDLKIASIVLASGAILVTRNLADFQKVPGLRCEDWAAEDDR
jgi:tRNA(fMet)-specific endonuclease VapC